MTATLSDQTIISTQRLQANDLDIESVTIFNDRAEIRREFQVTLKAGINEIRVENVASTIINDSIRLDGNGPATFHEVQFLREPAKQEEIDSDQVKQLVQKLNEFKEKKEHLSDQEEANSDTLEILNTLTTNAGKPAANANLDFNQSIEKTLDKLIDFHAMKNEAIRTNIRKHKKEIKQLDEEIQQVEKEIGQLRASRHWKKSILILLEATKDDVEVNLEMVYQVLHACWTPSYNVHVKTGGGEKNQAKIKITYFGKIQQESGEDWKNVDLVLSTSQPRFGGVLQKLGTLNAKFYRANDYINSFLKKRKERLRRPYFDRSRSRCRSRSRRRSRSRSRSVSRSRSRSQASPIRRKEFTPKENAIATTFSVPHKKTIPSDPFQHKVTITTIELDAILHYDVVPYNNTYVFLTADAINTSNYPLLSGMASIYVDNSFSITTKLGPVRVGEKFDCSLGIDPSIKVEYKPVNKYQQVIGRYNKISSTVNEQKVILKNTKRIESVLLTMHEYVPKSNDDEIKIKLVSPDITSTISKENNNKALKLPEVGAKLNNNHNLEWTVILAPDEERELTIKWTIDFPSNETIEYEEDF
uniref:Protein F37C4.5 n=1 Tax=Acrobeloides nanus TaxID=290746 RepID=A0A914E697_9BILA